MKANMNIEGIEIATEKIPFSVNRKETVPVH